MASPKHPPITGSCLCGSIKYQITFPETNWPPSNHICQCTMCRKATGCYLVPWLPVTTKQISWTPELKLSPPIHIPDGSTYQEYESSPGKSRGFCGKCSSNLVWRNEEQSANDGDEFEVEIQPGTLDEAVLIGEPVEKDVGDDRRVEFVGGCGREIALPRDGIFYSRNAIPGVTDGHPGGAMYWKGIKSEQIRGPLQGAK